MSDEALTDATNRLGSRILELLIVDWTSENVTEAAVMADAVGWTPDEDYAISMTARLTRALIEHEFGRIPPDMLDKLRAWKERSPE